MRKSNFILVLLFQKCAFEMVNDFFPVFFPKEGKLHKIEGIGAVEEVFVRLTNEIDKIK